MSRAAVACLLVLLILVGAPACRFPAVAQAAPSNVTLQEGTLQGARYRIEVPAQWNGTLLLYSHGYVLEGGQPRLIDAPSRATATWLLDNGYALAGSAYSRQGWAVQEALNDQLGVLGLFALRHPGLRRTVLWGSSMGGLITSVLAERQPQYFAGALSMCGALAGGVAEWNLRLDAAFVLKTLLAPGTSLALTEIQRPRDNVALARQVILEAQATPAGRARLAMASAVGKIPAWAAGEPLPPEGAEDMEHSLYLNWMKTDASFLFGQRASLEGRTGGNPSWNTGVDYAAQLRRSELEPVVQRLYQEAGLSLGEDLARLARTPRVAAQPAAVDYLSQYAAPTGSLGVPMLTVHTLGDPLVPASEERAYAQAVGAAGRTSLLRQLFVERGGHCTFTPAEQLAALQVLLDRIRAGGWPVWATPTQLNARAEGLGLGASAFGEKRPATFPRPYVPGRNLQPALGSS